MKVRNIKTDAVTVMDRITGLRLINIQPGQEVDVPEEFLQRYKEFFKEVKIEGTAVPTEVVEDIPEETKNLVIDEPEIIDEIEPDANLNVTEDMEDLLVTSLERPIEMEEIKKLDTEIDDIINEVKSFAEVKPITKIQKVPKKKNKKTKKKRHLIGQKRKVLALGEKPLSGKKISERKRKELLLRDRAYCHKK